MSYALRDHTADVAVEATAADLSALFAALADGLTAASAESVPAAGDRFEVTVVAESREALLFDYLDRLIYERDVRLVLPADHRCAVVGPEGAGRANAANGADAGVDPDGGTDSADPNDSADSGEWRLAASARGVPLDAVTAREVKAVTYSEMALEPRGDGWYAYVVFDV